eukprot:TRINITY_DN4907_c0_g2_i4.p1 TRINITY_DN4907_c0_g2~~TRINITY_DN4907_c0_g2_i4.p1  ORF type:complete len:131 (-),score=23.57 TRINITY_DN4907_c0_g2_i4:188-580(-)
MSPEVTMGLSTNGGTAVGYSLEADWWSLGCVFWEIIMGVPPITGETPEEIFQGIGNWETIIPRLLDEYKLYISAPCFDLISGFLCDPKIRKGPDFTYFHNHTFFTTHNINWADLHSHTPHFKPQLPSCMA